MIILSFGYFIFSMQYLWNNIWVAVVLKGMQAAVAAVILDAACDLGINAAKRKKYLVWYYFLLQPLFCDFIFQLNVIYIIFGSCCFGESSRHIHPSL